MSPEAKREVLRFACHLLNRGHSRDIAGLALRFIDPRPVPVAPTPVDAGRIIADELAAAEARAAQRRKAKADAGPS